MDGKHILIATTAASFFPVDRYKIVSVTRTDPASLAFKKMVSNRILSVPVYDRAKGCYTCFLDMVDIVAFCIKKFTDTSDLSKVMEEPLFETVNCGEISDISRRNPFFPVESSAPLLEALNLMVKWGVHRIPIVDAEGELITILSQSQVTTYIYKYLRSFSPSLLKRTAISIAASINKEEEDGEAIKSAISVGLKDRAIDAFIAMHDKRVSGVAVIDEDGKIVGNISASDLKAIGYDGTLITRLLYPISEFLKLIRTNTGATSTPSPTDTSPTHANPFSPPAVVSKDTLFGAVIGKLVNSRIHRLYVVDEEQRPIGVVGHGEILRAVQESFAYTVKSSDPVMYF